MVKSHIILILALIASVCPSTGQHKQRGAFSYGYEVAGGDTIQSIDIMTVYVFKNAIDRRRHQKLINNVKKVYPIAKAAQFKLAEVEQVLPTLASKKEQRAYIKQVEKELKQEYTPILKEMTFSQGKILIRLIDRQTHNTSYELVKELRGGFSAALWQGVARLFGANLKDGYDKDGEDAMVERIILLYEAGLI